MVHLRQTVAPAVPVLSTAEAKAHLRVDIATDDTLIDSLLDAATRRLEEYAGRAFITQTFQLVLDGFPKQKADTPGGDWWNGVREGALSEMFVEQRFIELPRAPIQEISEFVTFGTDNVDTAVDADSYFLDTAAEPGRVVLNEGYSWPSAIREKASVKLTYLCGFGDAASDVPETIIAAVKAFLAFLYEHRGDDTPGTIPKIARILIEPFCIRRFL